MKRTASTVTPSRVSASLRRLAALTESGRIGRSRAASVLRRFLAAVSGEFDGTGAEIAGRLAEFLRKAGFKVGAPSERWEQDGVYELPVEGLYFALNVSGSDAGGDFGPGVSVRFGDEESDLTDTREAGSFQEVADLLAQAVSPG